MEWPQLREEVSATAAGVAELLRAVPDGDLPLARVTWSAAELGAHLVGLPGRYVRMSGAPHPFPDSLSAENQREVDAIAERDPAVLADRLEWEVAALLDALGADGERRVWYFTVAPTAAGTYRLHLRGGDDWTLRVHEGAVTVERGRPRRADLHLSADPVGFLLGGVGLISAALRPAVPGDLSPA